MNDPRQPIAVIGLGYGDEGKGATVDWLCESRPVHVVVRHSGGSQALHHVHRKSSVTGVIDVHGYANFGCGTHKGIPTLLSRWFILNPYLAGREGNDIRRRYGIVDPWSLLYVDRRCVLTTPLHREANRLRESERDERHGSCGIGIGETVALTHAFGPVAAITISDSQAQIRVKWKNIEQMYRNQWGDKFRCYEDVEWFLGCVESFRDHLGGIVEDDSWLASNYERGWNVVFEGSQGTLLDEWRGFHPHTTWSTVTAKHARSLCKMAGIPEPYVLGALRSYMTRHGFGPFVTECDAEWFRSRVPEHDNQPEQWMGDFRVGHLDLLALKYAVKCNGGVDGLAVSHLDQIPSQDICVGYRVPNGDDYWDHIPFAKHANLHFQNLLTYSLQNLVPDLQRLPVGHLPLLNVIERELGAPVIVRGFGPTADDRAY